MATGRVYKRQKEGVWEAVVEYRDPANPNKRRWVARRFKRERDARVALQEMMRQHQDGVTLERKAETMAELLEAWLETKFGVRPRTYQNYEITIRCHLIPAIGPLRVQQVTPSDLTALYVTMHKEGKGLRVVRLCHLRLRQALDMAVLHGFISRNPARAIEPPPDSAGARTAWTVEESRQFLRVAARSGYGPVWHLALATGLRCGELLGLRWADVDLDADPARGTGTVTVRQQVGVLSGHTYFAPPKTAAGVRTIHVPRSVVARLRAHKAEQERQLAQRRAAAGARWADHDLVFPSRHGTPIQPRRLLAHYKRLVGLAGVRDITLHGLRHTFATQALAGGVPLRVVSEALGHASPSVTMMIYAHVLREHRHIVADVTGATLFADDGLDESGPIEAEKGADGASPSAPSVPSFSPPNGAETGQRVRHKRRGLTGETGQK